MAVVGGMVVMIVIVRLIVVMRFGMVMRMIMRVVVMRLMAVIVRMVMRVSLVIGALNIRHARE